MKPRNFISIFSFFLLIELISNLNGKFLSKFKKDNYLQKNITNDFRKLDEYDTYITVYFNEDFTYPTGFPNIFRNGINFIRNTQNDEKVYNGEALTINKNIAFEIHFNESVEDLTYFFLMKMMKIWYI